MSSIWGRASLGAAVRHAGWALVLAGLPFALLLTGAFLPGKAWADDASKSASEGGKSGGSTREEDRWVPGISLHMGVMAQEAKGSVRNAGNVPTFDIPNPDNWAEFPNIDKASGNDDLVTPLVGAELEIMSPSFYEVPNTPANFHFFLRGGVDASWSSRRNIASERSAFPMIDPMIPEAQTGAVQGQGSALRADVNSPFFTAGAGFAFSFKFLDRKFRLKPSVEYVRERMNFAGVWNVAYQTDPGQRANPILGIEERNAEFLYIGTVNPNKTDPDAEVRPTRQTAAETFHGIGFGLELEMDAARWGPVMITGFLGGRGYNFEALSDGRRVRMKADAGTITQEGFIRGPGNTKIPTGNDITAEYKPEWDFQKDAWGYRGVVGVRFRWLPE